MEAAIGYKAQKKRKLLKMANCLKNQKKKFYLIECKIKKDKQSNKLVEKR